MRIIYGIITLCFLFGQPVFGQVKYLSNAQDVAAVSQQVVKDFSMGQYDKAFSTVKMYWPFNTAEMDQMMTRTKESTQTIADRYGETVDYKLVKEQIVDRFIIHYLYAIRLEHHILRVELTWYNSGKGWHIRV